MGGSLGCGSTLEEKKHIIYLTTKQTVFLTPLVNSAYITSQLRVPLLSALEWSQLRPLDNSQHTLIKNGTFPSNSASQMYILRHDCDSLGVYGAEVSVLEEAYYVGFSSLLQGQHSVRSDPGVRSVLDTL